MLIVMQLTLNFSSLYHQIFIRFTMGEFKWFSINQVIIHQTLKVEDYLSLFLLLYRISCRLSTQFCRRVLVISTTMTSILNLLAVFSDNWIEGQGNSKSGLWRKYYVDSVMRDYVCRLTEVGFSAGSNLPTWLWIVRLMGLFSCLLLGKPCLLLVANFSGFRCLNVRVRFCTLLSESCLTVAVLMFVWSVDVKNEVTILSELRYPLRFAKLLIGSAADILFASVSFLILILVDLDQEID